MKIAWTKVLHNDDGLTMTTNDSCPVNYLSTDLLVTRPMRPGCSDLKGVAPWAGWPWTLPWHRVSGARRRTPSHCCGLSSAGPLWLYGAANAKSVYYFGSLAGSKLNLNSGWIGVQRLRFLCYARYYCFESYNSSIVPYCHATSSNADDCYDDLNHFYCYDVLTDYCASAHPSYFAWSLSDCFVSSFGQQRKVKDCLNLASWVWLFSRIL